MATLIKATKVLQKTRRLVKRQHAFALPNPGRATMNGAVSRFGEFEGPRLTHSADLFRVETAQRCGRRLHGRLEVLVQHEEILSATPARTGLLRDVGTRSEELRQRARGVSNMADIT